MSSMEIDAAVVIVLAANPDDVANYHASKTQALGTLFGKVMRLTRGQEDTRAVQAALRAKLERPRYDA